MGQGAGKKHNPDAVPGSERRTQQQRREETRARLMDAAIELIRTDGCASLTTAKVAKAAGLTRGAIQYHFSSPKDLLGAVIIHIVQQLNVRVASADLEGLNKEDRLDRLIDHYWQEYQSGIYVVFLEIATQGHRDPELKQIVADAISSMDQERNEHWLSYFQDYSQSQEEILAWRTTFLVLLRGLVVKKMFSPEDEDMDMHFQHAKAMFHQSVFAGEKKSKA